MTTLLTCIANAEQENVIDAPRAQRARQLYTQIFQRLRDQGSTEDEAHRLAGPQAFREYKAELSEKKRRLALTIAKQREISKRLADYVGPNGADPGRAGIAFFDRLDPYRNGHAFEARHDAWRKRAHAHMTEAITTLSRSTLTFQRNRATALDMVRELFGTNTGNQAARELAHGWREAAELLRQGFNRAGGSIGKRNDWGLPQSHDLSKVGAVPEDEWVTYTRDLLDRDQMIDGITGNRLTDLELDEALRETYRNIKTDGWQKRQPSGISRGASKARTRADGRFLVFQDADAWLEYQSRFGHAETDPFAVMMGHIDGMARDIALMELFGPDPAAGVTFLKQSIEKSAAGADTSTRKRAENAQGTIDALYAHASGTANQPTNSTLANVLDGTRNMLIAAQLGGAAPTAVVSDLNFGRLARAFNGVPQSQMLGTYLKQLNPADDADRKAALRLMLGAESYAQTFHTMSRYTDEAVGPEITKRIASGVLNLTGLSAHTDASRQAFGMDFLTFLGGERGKAFDQLPEATQGALQRYGIGPDDWEVIRATNPRQHRGADVLDPQAIFDRGGRDLTQARAEDLGFKVLDMIQTETEFSVPSSSLRGRAAILDTTRPGSIPGSVMRSFLMYKNFSLTMWFAHGRRVMAQKDPKERAGYMFALVFGSAMAGAAALQFGEISKGRNPRPMDTAEFWAAATLKGGGLGLLGDFVYLGVSGRHPYGLSLEQAIAGPVFGFAADALEIATGTPLDLVTGEAGGATTGRQVTSFLQRYTPGSSIWWARLAMERYIWDGLREATDPNAYARFRRLKQIYQKELGTDYYWAPGEQWGLDGSRPQPPQFIGDDR